MGSSSSSRVSEAVKPKTVRAELLAIASGAVLGLSAPGFDQWYLAWCGLVPFFLLMDWSRSLWSAAFRGWLFGLGYHLLFLSWMLKLNPPQWVGIQSTPQLILVAAALWLCAAVISSVVFALIAFVMRLLLQKGWLTLVAGEEKLGPASLVVLPLLWVVVFGVCGNQPDLLLMPMAALEYSQYKSLGVIQMCSVVGGVGLQFLMVAQNVALSMVAASMARTGGGRMLPAERVRAATAQWLAVVCLTAGATIYGAQSTRIAALEPDESVSVLQSGLMLATERKGRGLQVPEVLAMAMPIIDRCPPGLVVWTEQSLPMLFDATSTSLEPLKSVAADRHLDIIFGIEEPSETAGKKYNAAAAITSTGDFAPTLYRKRYLIPFGEFEPLILRCIPASVRQSIGLPQTPPFLADSDDVVLKLSSGVAALLICGENIDAASCARSVKKGGQVIANISNLNWFHGSILGAQSLATAVIRAVENRRYYIYAADTGPSFVVDPYGRVVARLGWGEVSVLSTKFKYVNEQTLFCKLAAW